MSKEVLRELMKLAIRVVPLFVIALVLVVYLDQAKLLLYKLSLVLFGWAVAETGWRLYVYTTGVHLEDESPQTALVWAIFRGLVYASVIFSFANAL